MWYNRSMENVFTCSGLKAGLAAVAFAALVLPCGAVQMHRSFRNALPVTPANGHGARTYGRSFTNPGMGVVSRREATPPFDFFTSGRFTLGGVHINDLRREVVRTAPKSGAASIQERVLEEKDGKPLVKEMILLGSQNRGILVGRVGPQGGSQTEYRVGQLSVLLRNDSVEQVQAAFIAEGDMLAKFRDWVKSVFDKKCGVNKANVNVIPRGGFDAEPEVPRKNEWKSGGFVYELRYEPNPSRLIISAHR